jgi:hypothetical protein
LTVLAWNSQTSGDRGRGAESTLFSAVVGAVKVGGLRANFGAGAEDRGIRGTNSRISRGENR